MAYTAQFFTPADAERMGMISKIVAGSREEVVAAALDLAKVISSKSPVAVSGTKHLITHSRDHTCVLWFSFGQLISILIGWLRTWPIQLSGTDQLSRQR